MGRRILQVVLFPVLCIILAGLFIIDIVLWIFLGNKYFGRSTNYLIDKVVNFFSIK